MRRSLVGLVLILMATSASGQSLAEVAKKTEEEHAKSGDKAPSKSYTDKDLKPVPGGSSSATDAVKTDAVEKSDKATGAAAASKAEKVDTTTKLTMSEAEKAVAIKDESYWKDRIRRAQAALDADLTFYAAGQQRERELAASLKVEPDRLQRITLTTRLQDARTELSKLDSAVKNSRRAITVIQEEARRLGIPPGWLRP